MNRDTPAGDLTGTGEDIAGIIRTSYRAPAGGDDAAWIDGFLVPEDHRLMAAPRGTRTGDGGRERRPRTSRGQRAPQAT